MDMQIGQPEKLTYRPAQDLMTLSRMGSFHQTRLSFMRTLLRRLVADEWRFETKRFEIDTKGVGVAVYSAIGPDHTYSLIAFANDLPPEKRSDRVIATEWDATFTLFDGVPDDGEIERLRANIPLQEAGRVSERELSMSRANRSVRLWDHVVSALAKGDQPDPELVASVGYLMRTTAVYGSGKFGVADREVLTDRCECRGPFQIEMLTVYLIRTFVMDLVEYLAKMRSPQTAVALDPQVRRSFGIGNSTGLGMAPFVVNHPMLINNWILAKEEALLRVRSVKDASETEVETFLNLLPRVHQNVEEWRSQHSIQLEKLSGLKKDLSHLEIFLQSFDFTKPYPWQRLLEWSEAHLSLEGQEQLISLMMEPYPDLIDGLTDCMDADEAKGFRIDGRMSVENLKQLCEEIYAWALEIDWSETSANARAWYVSEEKLEPRLGERFEEDISNYEQPLQPGRDAARMYAHLTDAKPGTTVAAFLLAHPEHRHIARRCQLAQRYPYAEVRDNTICASMMPIDLLRAKLSFFGAGHFDPRSDRWVRINMFKGAAFPHELQSEYRDDWPYPILTDAG